MSSMGRIRKEIEDLRNDKASGVSIEIPEPSDPMHMIGTIKGPSDTPYAGGTFHVDINIPKDYPFSPPKMKFITKVWHPNISSVTGAICLDILKDQWSPALTMKTALLSLQALMCSPEPNDPQDAVVATMYKERHEEFVRTAREWTAQYAGSVAVISPALQRLLDMGFAEADARRALAECKGDENAAIESLLADVIVKMRSLLCFVIIVVAGLVVRVNSFGWSSLRYKKTAGQCNFMAASSSSSPSTSPTSTKSSKKVPKAAKNAPTTTKPQQVAKDNASNPSSASQTTPEVRKIASTKGKKEPRSKAEEVVEDKKTIQHIQHNEDNGVQSRQVDENQSKEAPHVEQNPSPSALIDWSQRLKGWAPVRQ